MDQVPSKQRAVEDAPNRVNQKCDDDDADDLILDPDSPRDSVAPSVQSHFTSSNTSHNLMASQQLKVNQRHQRRQEALRNRRSIDEQSVASSNLYRLS